MKLNNYLKAFLLVVTLGLVISCDKDYNGIGTSVIDDNHYGFEQDSTKSVVAYNQAVGPVQTNNLALNALGFYNHPVFGKTKANFVTQVELIAANPKFINPAAITIDSVYLYVPYFSKLKSTDPDTGDRTYTLDSVYGGTAKFKLSVYESGYYLRDFDPSTGLQQAQKYYSDQNADFDANKLGTPLNNNTLFESQNSEFSFKPSEYQITYQKDGQQVIKERKAPGMWLDLDKTFFKNKIFNAPAGKLINNNVFKDYFRGLYFQVDAADSSPNGGAMSMLNFKQGKIYIEYEDETSATDPTRKKRSMALNLAGNSVNLFENENTATSSDFASAISNNVPDDVTGDEKLFLKGQSGAISVIDILNQDEINEIKSNGWLINEANLSFYIDKTAMTDSFEPNRIYLYDLNNRRPLLDYYSDFSTRSNPKFNKSIHGGIIDTETVNNGRGIRYKIRITNHVRNLIKNDSTNVRLGLAVTESITTTSNLRLKNPIPSSTIDRLPTASVINPLGTVLYGSRSNVPVAKRLKLKIYYTKPD